MNKRLLALAGLLSLLVINQAFCWRAPIKNETAIRQDLVVRWTGATEPLSIPAGQNMTIWSGNRLPKNLIGLHVTGGVKYASKKDKDGKIINPLKGLTIKTVNGQTVVVENP